jgi:hypothetical protein
MENKLNIKGSIRTYSGMYVNFINPDPETFIIEDIAYALSKEQRFGNHLPVRYSVAQHCVMAAKNTKGDKFEALMHDASEAYLRDMPSPIKALLKDYKKLEHKLNLVLSKQFNFNYPFSDNLHEIDKELLIFEWNHFVLGEPLPKGFKVWSQKRAEKEFLKMYNKVKRNG